MKLKIKFPIRNLCTKNRYLIKPVAFALLTIIACAFSLKTAAFDPDEAAYGHSMITRSIATEGYVVIMGSDQI